MPMPAAMSSFNLFTSFSLAALYSPSAGPVYSAGKEVRTETMQEEGGEWRKEG
jgi:hypothetical protein